METEFNLSDKRKEDYRWQSSKRRNKMKRLRYCKKCKKRTPHTEHGFIGSNYRETCDVCGTINHVRYGI